MRKESDDPECFAFRLFVIIFLAFIAVMAYMAYVVFVENGDTLANQVGMEQFIANLILAPQALALGPILFLNLNIKGLSCTRARSVQDYASSVSLFRFASLNTLNLFNAYLTCFWFGACMVGL